MAPSCPPDPNADPVGLGAPKAPKPVEGVLIFENADGVVPNPVARAGEDDMGAVAVSVAEAWVRENW